MTDASGTVVWAADYKPFGEADITASTVTNNFRFPGQYFDQETGLNYNYYRDYNSKTGRYIESDPIGLNGGINLFAYVDNNSINFIDPLGLKKNKCKKDPCAHLLPKNIPPSVNIDTNIALAESVKKSSSYSEDGIYYVLSWFYSQVKNKGPWDYKQLGSQYQEFGNFNYGATGTAAGFSKQTLQRGAGWAQEQAGTSKKEWGHWYKRYPYGDDPQDQRGILQGIEYYNCRRANKND